MGGPGSGVVLGVGAPEVGACGDGEGEGEGDAATLGASGEGGATWGVATGRVGAGVSAAVDGPHAASSTDNSRMTVPSGVVRSMAIPSGASRVSKLLVSPPLGL